MFLKGCCVEGCSQGSREGLSIAHQCNRSGVGGDLSHKDFTGLRRENLICTQLLGEVREWRCQGWFGCEGGKGRAEG